MNLPRGCFLALFTIKIEAFQFQENVLGNVYCLYIHVALNLGPEIDIP